MSTLVRLCRSTTWQTAVRQSQTFKKKGPVLCAIRTRQKQNRHFWHLQRNLKVWRNLVIAAPFVYTACAAVREKNIKQWRLGYVYIKKITLKTDSSPYIMQTHAACHLISRISACFLFHQHGSMSVREAGQAEKTMHHWQAHKLEKWGKASDESRVIVKKLTC